MVGVVLELRLPLNYDEAVCAVFLFKSCGQIKGDFAKRGNNFAAQHTTRFPDTQWLNTCSTYLLFRPRATSTRWSKSPPVPTASLKSTKKPAKSDPICATVANE
jgi:hypothetical protein